MYLTTLFFSFTSQLQPLVARMHCGDLQYIMRSLLTDRLDGQKGEEKEEKVGCIKRSIYRQMLFLKCVLFPDTIDIGKCACYKCVM